MEAMGTISGGAIVVKKYQAGTTITRAGVPLIGSLTSATDLASVEPMTTSTALVNGNVGLGIDVTGTVAATTTADSNDLLISCAVNPDLIIRCKMNNGTTEDTALTLFPTSAADATGVTTTGTTSLDQGVQWGYDGANKGHFRRMNDASGSTAINFANAIASGDNFLFAGGFPCCYVAASLSNGPNLTTNLTQGDASTATPGDNDSFQIFDLQLGTEDDDGQNNSFWHFIAQQHVFGSSGIE